MSLSDPEISMSSDSVSSVKETSVPLFPERRDDYADWKLRMHAYLELRDLWDVVSQPVSVGIGKGSGHGKDDDDKSSSSSSSSSLTEDEVTELADKQKKVHYLLLMAFRKKQLALVRQYTWKDVAEVWKKIDSVYGTVKTTESQAAMLDQLNKIRKNRNESIEDYIARVDKLISDLAYVGEKVSSLQRKYYIMKGLEGLEEWELDVKFIRKSEHDSSWSDDKFDQYI
jgi:hypothetical protein